jgi:NADH:ubiquinone oxidoreductase subunit E
MNVFVCVGSSCHIKGSSDIIELIKQKIKEHNLEKKVNLSAAFCLGKCTDGVSIKVDGNIICGVSKENFEKIFENYILKDMI